MFGIVPKPVWSKLLRPDRANRVPQVSRCLLVELDDGRVGVVESGCGPASLYPTDHRRHHRLDAGLSLPVALQAAGVAPEAISFVILTHLHWDHAGGLRRAEPDAQPMLAFPEAEHVLHEREWRDATGGDPLLHKAYPAAVIAPLRACPQRLRLVEGDDTEVFPGVRLVQTGGHTAGHCAVVFDEARIVCPGQASGAASRCVLAGDVCPTRHHLRLVYQTSYDCFPLATRAWKRRWLPAIADDGDVLLFVHDPHLVGATLRCDGRGFEVDGELRVPKPGGAGG